MPQSKKSLPKVLSVQNVKTEFTKKNIGLMRQKKKNDVSNAKEQEVMKKMPLRRSLRSKKPRIDLKF